MKPNVLRAKIYKNDVNLEHKSNPLVMTVDYILEKSVVLDVGCACGDLGVALKEHKNASMFGFEYNQGSIDVALETGAYQEIHQINLDELTEDDYKEYKDKFDYIVCGDVLEHLRYPMQTLNILKSYLKEGGFIIASIPNVAHMSIKSNLLVNDFTYTPVGLLDETHIHLFTYKSIAQGLSDINLQIEECKFTLQNKEAWQPNNPYGELPLEVKEFIFNDWHSYVCQYVMKISKSTKNVDDLIKHNLDKIIIDEQKAPEYIKNYRNECLKECFIERKKKDEPFIKMQEELNRVKTELSSLNLKNVWKKMRYPRWLVKIVCCFIPKEKNRKRFRRKYTLAK